jgi:lipopolysaccharide/colanic/teichoic acid biosynthesis glycosyltransferase
MSLSSVRLVPRVRTAAAPSSYLEEVQSSPLFYDKSKRVIDVCGSVALLVALSPLLLVIALLVKLTSPGPIIFRHRRLGQHGQTFFCLKFRTMVKNAEELLRQREDLRKEFEATFKLKNDPRLTRIGRFLRKTSLDELPQLFNVLRGDLSLIGPRPIVPSERAKYGVHLRKLLSVKPGLGGYWQVYGRSDTTYAERIAMDMEYIDNRSLGLDLKLAAMTARVVIEGRGAY